MTLYALDDFQPEVPASGQYWVAPTALVIGKVILKDEASIWFGSVLRGDNEPIVIGEGTIRACRPRLLGPPLAAAQIVSTALGCVGDTR